MNRTDITIIIKTFERPKSLSKLLQSLQKQNICCPVLVADDSKTSYCDQMMKRYRRLLTDYIVLNHDVGLSAGRNELLKRVQTKYFLLCDDDYIFTCRTNVDTFLRLFEEYDLDLLCGIWFKPFVERMIIATKKVSTFSWNVGRALRYLFDPYVQKYNEGVYEICSCGEIVICKEIKYVAPVTRCDYTHNFFIAKTDCIRQLGGWDEDLILGEHNDFFLRAKQSHLKIGTTHEIGVVHNPYRNSGVYRKLRRREGKYKIQFMRKHGLKAFVGRDMSPTNVL